MTPKLLRARPQKSDFDGYFAGRTSDTYVFGLHAALYSGGQAQDLNYLTDTSSHPEVAHVAMERALAIDGGKVLVSSATAASACSRQPAPPDGERQASVRVESGRWPNGSSAHEVVAAHGL